LSVISSEQEYSTQENNFKLVTNKKGIIQAIAFGNIKIK